MHTSSTMTQLSWLATDAAVLTQLTAGAKWKHNPRAVLAQLKT